MKKITLTLAMLSAIIAGSVLAHSGVKGIAKQRMGAMSDNSKIAADIMKGTVEYSNRELTMDDRLVIANYFMSDENQT